MSQRHTIRLHGPWSLVDENRSTVRIRLPCSQLDTARSGSDRLWQLERHFNWPHAIETGQSFAIEVLSSFPWNRICLNGHSLDFQSEASASNTGQLFSTRVPIDAPLQPRNLLTMQFSDDSKTPLQIQQVMLVIEDKLVQ